MEVSDNNLNSKKEKPDPESQQYDRRRGILGDGNIDPVTFLVTEGKVRK